MTFVYLFVFVFAKDVLWEIWRFKFSIPKGPPRRLRKRAKEVKMKEEKKKTL